MKDALAKLFTAGLRALVAPAMALLVTWGLLSQGAADALGAEAMVVVALAAGLMAALVVKVGEHVYATKISKISTRGEDSASVGHEAQQPASGGEAPGQGPLPLVLALCGLAATLSLPSCETLARAPITGSLIYRDAESGAKGGLVFAPGKAPVASIKVPIYDVDGKQTGMAELSGPLAREVSVEK